MSFVLPGNARQLRFTGEVKALAPDADAASEREEQPATGTELGKPRVRRPPASQRLDTRAHAPEEAPASQPPPSHPPAPRHEAAPRSQPAPRSQRLMPPPPPSEPAPRVARAPRLNPALYARAPVVREKPLVDPDPSIDDNCLTMAMVRDGLDVLPGANALGAKPQRARGPMPFIRSRPLYEEAPMPAQLARSAKTVKLKRERTLPLAVWLVAAVIAGLVSFRLAPELVSRLDRSALTQR